VTLPDKTSLLSSKRSSQARSLSLRRHEMFEVSNCTMGVLLYDHIK